MAKSIEEEFNSFSEFLKYDDPVILDENYNFKLNNTIQLGYPKRIPLKSKSAIEQMNDSISKEEIEETLNAIFQPKILQNNEDGHSVIQKVLLRPISDDNEEISELFPKLEMLLNARSACKTGICPIRHGLYMKLFEELIRQTIIECPERGILLSRVRDENKETLSAYYKFYEGVENQLSQLSLLHSLQAEDSQMIIESFKGENLVLQNNIDEIRAIKHEKEFLYFNEKKERQENWQERFNYFQNINIQLKQQLDIINDPSRLTKKKSEKNETLGNEQEKIATESLPPTSAIPKISYSRSMNTTRSAQASNKSFKASKL